MWIVAAHRGHGEGQQVIFSSLVRSQAQAFVDSLPRVQPHPDSDDDSVGWLYKGRRVFVDIEKVPYG